MRVTCLFLIVTVLLQFALQTQAAQPEIGVIYFRPSDRTAPSDIDSKIDTLVKAAQTAYSNEMTADGYSGKTFKFQKNDDDTVKVNHVTGDHDNAHYLEADGWDIWAEITTAGFDQSKNIYIAFLDFSSGTVDGGWCGTGGDYLDGSLGGAVNMAIASGCFDGNHGTAILVHELGHAFGLRHDYRNHPDYSINLVDNDPMVTSACATKWLSGHPYFNDYTTTPAGSTTISIGTPSISGSEVTVTFTITDDDSLHQAHFFETVTDSYGAGFDDLSLLDCEDLSGTSDTATFTTSALESTTTSVSIRVMDALGRATEHLFSVDLSDLSQTSGSVSTQSMSTQSVSTQSINTGEQRSMDVNGDGTVDIKDVNQVVSKFNQTGNLPEDINGDGIVNIVDITLVAQEAGANPGAPSISPRGLENALTRAEVEKWLHEARQMNLKDPEFQRGILALEQFLVALMPKKTMLLPNYPNPFNPETWIPYQLSETVEVAISIYDVSGNVVRSLDLGHQVPGFYHSHSEAAYWDGRNNLNERVASGIYFYHIQAGEFSATRRMLILK